MRLHGQRTVLAALHRPRRARPHTADPGPRVRGCRRRAGLRHCRSGCRRRGVRPDRRLSRWRGGGAHRHRGTRRRARTDHDRPCAGRIASPGWTDVVASAVRSRPSTFRPDRDDPWRRWRGRIDRGATRQGEGCTRHRQWSIEGEVPGPRARRRRVRRRRAGSLAGRRQGRSTLSSTRSAAMFSPGPAGS